MGSDKDARLTALDVNQSFIVQAPAGSGKTELLIQRYLSLLASVDIPEEVIAITFTRKAEAEMRHRIVCALKNANKGVIPDNEHNKKTFYLALDVLKKSASNDWNIAEQPQRLTIETLDALNLRVAKKMPLLSGGIADSKVIDTDRFNDVYLSVAEKLVSRINDSDELSDDLIIVIRHLNFNYSELVGLLANLLSSRDQWLEYIIFDQPIQLVNSINQATVNLIEDELKELSEIIPEKTLAELITLLEFAIENTKSDTFKDLSDSQAFLKLNGNPKPISGDIKIWQALGKLLLTKDGAWRNKGLHHVGFYKEHIQMYDQFKNMIKQCSGYHGISKLLMTIIDLPQPFLTDEDEALLTSLCKILRYLTAELKIYFEKNNLVDFVETAITAKQALGAETEPSDLLLALDRKIKHILVDEFQDTSQSQIRFLELLTAGWQSGDGRSLFLVGDPMQSIYRFRNAEMSLFLNVRKYGLGNISCRPLTLETNYRSCPDIISWVNQTFVNVFPEQDDFKVGAAQFTPCMPDPARLKEQDEFVNVHVLRESYKDEEIIKVGQIVREECSKYPNQTLAILVRNRGHLSDLMAVLKSHQIPVRAVEIESLSQQQVIQDLIGLTRALTHLGDRIAWLSLLRSPWCGLTLSDLQKLCGDDSSSAIWELMHDKKRISSLTIDSKNRLIRVRELIEYAFHTRSYYTLDVWIERTWKSMGGHKSIESIDELNFSKEYFIALSKLDLNSDLNSTDELEKYFSAHKVSNITQGACGVEIMTIHRAKGLQFDSVIVLGLGRELSPGKSRRGLYWLERFDRKGKRNILLASNVKASNSGNNLLSWLKKMERIKNQSEESRLLYVATTRARKRLHLVGQIKGNRPPNSSLFSRIWESLNCNFKESVKPIEKLEKQNSSITPVLRRLKMLPKILNTENIISKPPEKVEYSWASQSAIQVGTVVHELLHRITIDGIKNWSPKRIIENSSEFEFKLRMLGVHKPHLDQSVNRVKQALVKIMEDSTGLWILQEHNESSSEHIINFLHNNVLQQLRIDRTFIDEHGTRWIIDYKTSSHEGGSKDEFLESELNRYKGQLELYAKAYSKMDNTNIKVGLYFPLLQAFQSWTPEIHH